MDQYKDKGKHKYYKIDAPASIKITSFYEKDTSGKKIIKNDLFDETAKKVAETLGSREANAGVSSTQLRRFYDEVKRYDMILETTSEDEWKNHKPFVCMLKSKIAYSVARIKSTDWNKPYYRNLSDFLSSGIDCVESAEDYHVFATLFEAVYGFYYELAPKN